LHSAIGFFETPRPGLIRGELKNHARLFAPRSRADSIL
jgi:hypothetical protein